MAVEKTVLVTRETTSVGDEAPTGEEIAGVSVPVTVAEEADPVPTASVLEIDVRGRLMTDEPGWTGPLPPDGSDTPEDADGELKT